MYPIMVTEYDRFGRPQDSGEAHKNGTSGRRDSVSCKLGALQVQY
jgi:hypothetical protein